MKLKMAARDEKVNGVLCQPEWGLVIGRTFTAQRQEEDIYVPFAEITFRDR